MNEAERLAALASYDVLDTPPEPVFDRLTKVVAEILGVPIALVSLVDGERQWFKSRQGIEASETPRDISFCGHVVADDRPLVVRDVLQDRRFADNPLVVGPPGIRFYAGYPLRTAEGHVLGTLCAVDRRPRELAPKQLELLEVLAGEVLAQLELRRKNAVLVRLNEEKNTLLGVAAHDLRNPIASILGNAALLLEGGLERLQSRRALEAIDRVSRQMLALVNDLLDVSAIESGRLELRPEPCALDVLLGERVEFFRLHAARKGIAITAACETIVVELDPQRVEQVIDNLLSNAVKYSPRGARIEASLALDGEEAVLAVTDHGPGLTEEDRLRLFGAFQRLSARPTGGEKSTGLGLAIAHRIVTAHGGRIEVESQAGAGATFRVRLPRARSAPPDVPSQSQPVPAAPEPLRVLMVDDDEDIRLAVELSLVREAGFEVRCCADLEEALAALACFHPDLLLLDVEMPGADGPATLARLRREPITASTPAVFLTARAEPAHVARYQALGALEVIGKPFDALTLGERLREVLRGA